MNITSTVSEENSVVSNVWYVVNPPLLHHHYQGQGEALNPLPCHGELAQVTHDEDGGEEPEHYQFKIIICMQLHLFSEREELRRPCMKHWISVLYKQLQKLLSSIPNIIVSIFWAISNLFLSLSPATQIMRSSHHAISSPQCS